jgi:hypothetical protein
MRRASGATQAAAALRENHIYQQTGLRCCLVMGNTAI